MGFYWIALRFTGLYWVLLGFTEFYRVFFWMSNDKNEASQTFLGRGETIPVRRGSTAINIARRFEPDNNSNNSNNQKKSRSFFFYKKKSGADRQKKTKKVTNENGRRRPFRPPPFISSVLSAYFHFFLSLSLSRSFYFLFSYFFFAFGFRLFDWPLRLFLFFSRSSNPSMFFDALLFFCCADSINIGRTGRKK